ncbi:MAG: hypothetical protein LCH32_09040 [Bacteroidetes bacterium]|nr:hypothetical protein [Bacteroidota bacterium]
MLELLIDIGIYSNFFSSGAILFTKPFEFYYSYAPLIILLAIFSVKFPFYTPNLYLLIPLLIFGVFNVAIGNNNINNFLKIFLNITINLIFYQYVMHYYNYDVKLMIKKYLTAVFLISCLGLFQYFSHIVGFEPGVNFKIWLTLDKWNHSIGGFGLRINSLHAEPSYLGTIHAPAAFICLYKLIKPNLDFIDMRRAIIILICYVLSSSSLAFLGLFLAIILISFNFGAIKYFLATVPLVIFIAIYTYNNSKDFKMRVDGLNKTFVEGLLDEDNSKPMGQTAKREKAIRLIRSIHGSSFVLYNNYYVAMKNLENNYLFGSGLGSHEIAYAKYNLTAKLGGVYKFNAADANSTFLRTLSEAGLVGVLFLLYFMFKFYISKPRLGDDLNQDYWIISNALFIVIFLQYLRQGNYTLGGFFFFCWMYYYNYKNMITEEAKLEEEKENNQLEQKLA